MATIAHIELRPMKWASNAEGFELSPIQRSIGMTAEIFYRIQLAAYATYQNLELSTRKRGHLAITEQASIVYRYADFSQAPKPAPGGRAG